jgi:hypothetical protein
MSEETRIVYIVDDRLKLSFAEPRTCICHRPTLSLSNSSQMDIGFNVLSKHARNTVIMLLASRCLCVCAEFCKSPAAVADL